MRKFSKWLWFSWHMFEVAVIIVILLFITKNMVINHSAKDYIGAYTCSECDKVFVRWSDYCEHCGAENTDEDLVQMRPRCSECGKSTSQFSKTYCTECGGFLVNKGKQKISDIDSKWVRWCVKHI